MSTRSANNKRNQEKLQGASGSGMAASRPLPPSPPVPRAGSVRVVPATAKAKRAAAERGEDLSNLSKEEKKARKAELRREEDRIYTASSQLMKEDEDYLRYRRIWWVLLVIGILALIGTWVLLAVLGQDGMADKGAQTAQFALIVAAYAAIIVAFIFDFIKIRPIRNACRDKAAGMTAAKLDDVIARSMAAQGQEAGQVAYVQGRTYR